jgi:L,D-transpeptidase YbiS
MLLGSGMRAFSWKSMFGLPEVFWYATLFMVVIFVADAPGSRSVLPIPADQNTESYFKASTSSFPVDDDAPYITINVAAGRICLRTADTVWLEARCSAGSGAKLRDPATGRVWNFATPTGVFRVQAKAEDPIWKKPDWAYLEDGLPIPENPADRLTANELGRYSLNLGGGLFIHGTLYTRLLGMNVTHGCIRVGDDDLEKIYGAVKTGAPVYIFNSGDYSADSSAEQIMEIDYGSGLVRLLMDGQVIWETSFTGSAINNSSKSMHNAVTARHLYTGRGEYKKRELAVVADELSIEPEKLQRIYPGRFAVVLDDGSVWEITTDIDAATFSNWDNVCFDAIRLISAPFGERCRQLAVGATDALTLYNLVRPGSVISIR